MEMKATYVFMVTPSGEAFLIINHREKSFKEYPKTFTSTNLNKMSRLVGLTTSAFCLVLMVLRVSSGDQARFWQHVQTCDHICKETAQGNPQNCCNDYKDYGYKYGKCSEHDGDAYCSRYYEHIPACDHICEIRGNAPTCCQKLALNYSPYGYCDYSVNNGMAFCSPR